MAERAAFLLKHGYVTIPIDELGTVDAIEANRQRLSEEIAAFPEYAPEYVAYGLEGVNLTGPLVLGGFSALGNPASFHNPFVREWRQRLHGVARDLFQHLVHTEGFPLGAEAAAELKVEQLVDRLMVRPAGAAPTPESWHRDSSPGASGIVFGGWVNFDHHAQRFSCVPDTHMEEWRQACDAMNAACAGGGISGGSGGAAAAPAPAPPMHAALAAAAADLKRQAHKALVTSGSGFSLVGADIKAYCKARKQLIEVPAGHLLVFADPLLHEVVGKKVDSVMARLFTGWHLTLSSRPLIADILKRVEDMAVVRIKSAQMPRMHAQMHVCFAKERIDALEAVIKPEFLDPHTKKMTSSPKCPSLRSLREAGHGDAYAPYSDQERAILVPHFLFERAVTM